MIICLEESADLHMTQPMPLPLTVSCFSKIQIGFAFLVLAHLGIPGQRDVCVCVSVEVEVTVFLRDVTYCRLSPYLQLLTGASANTDKLYDG